jgi:hypothetical protein
MIMTLKQFAVEVGAKYGTVKRWAHEGMPVIRGGHEKQEKGGTLRMRVDVTAATAWLDERRRNQRMGPKHGANRRSVIFFAHDEDRDLIRISFSSDPEARLKDFRKHREGAHRNVKIVGTMPGDMLIELRIQGMFSHLRVESEWFQADPELWRFIRLSCGDKKRRA